MLLPPYFFAVSRQKKTVYALADPLGFGNELLASRPAVELKIKARGLS